MKKVFLFSTLIALVIGLVSCTKEIDIVDTTGITISPASMTLLDGTSGDFIATVAPQNATGTFLKWKSSNNKVAVVDNYGRVAAKGPGTATITASSSDGKVSGTATIIVTEIAVTGISLNPSSVDLTIEQDEKDVFSAPTQAISVSFTPSNASIKDLKWTSSNTDVATVDENGVVTAVSYGTANITATTKSGAKTATSVVSVTYKLPDKAAVVNKWTTDDAGRYLLLGGDSDVVSDFLTYSHASGAVTWTANNTGKPRTATLTTGESSITITQMESKDFKGNWDFVSKRFAGSNKLGITSANKATVPVSFSIPLSSDAIEDECGPEGKSVSRTNNIGILGLFSSAIMDACVDIDYKDKTVKLGLFFDARSAQFTSTGDSDYPYVVFLPELGDSFVGAPWNFTPFPLGKKQNYGWIWFDCNETFNKFTYNVDNAQAWGVGGDISSKVVIGITVLGCKSATPSKDNLRSNNISSGSGYDLIYQGDTGYNSISASEAVKVGMYFQAK